MKVMLLDLAYPFTGRWLVQNSPADRVPSHGTAAFGSAFAIDFVPVDDDGRTAPVRFATFVRPEPPDRFPGFGRTILSPVTGTVIATVDSLRDHAAYRGLPSIGYALTQGRRTKAGWQTLAGNHVLIEHAGIVVALCHLQHGSILVDAGRVIRAGDAVACCGNSGNSTEPHLHLQAFDGRDPDRAEGIPIAFSGGLPRGGQIVDV